MIYWKRALGLGIVPAFEALKPGNTRHREVGSVLAFYYERLGGTGMNGLTVSTLKTRLKSGKILLAIIEKAGITSLFLIAPTRGEFQR